MSTLETGATTFKAWSSTMRLVVDDARVLPRATADLTALLNQVERAASRFRTDSALSIANERAGRPTPVPRLLVDLVAAALHVAERTDGLVTPLVGTALQTIGYDRDITAVVDDPAPITATAIASHGRLRLDREFGLLTVPVGSALDLGATAKAYTADLAARTLSQRYATAVLVELGGDLAVAGSRADGWCVQVAEAEARAAAAAGQLLLVRRGGLATSTTTLRRWNRAGRPVHHIIDPRTGLPADGPWRTVSAAAPSALEANLATTASIVLGADAVDWLEQHHVAARLVARDGTVTTTTGWPAARRRDAAVA